MTRRYAIRKNAGAKLVSARGATEHRREIRRRVAAEIRRARYAAGLTQIEFAARMKKSQRWASVTENAKGAVWIHELPDIGKALGLDAHELLRRALKQSDEDAPGARKAR